MDGINLEECTSLFNVDGVVIRCPTSFTWGLKDITKKHSGMTSDDLMHKIRSSQKRTFSVSWTNLSAEDAHEVLKAFNPLYIELEYFDVLDWKIEKRTFYTGDISAPYKRWTINNKTFSSISFELEER